MSDCPYALTNHHVTITNVVADDITFRTRSDDSTDQETRAFTCKRSQILPSATQSLPADAPAHITQVQQGASGLLCLHRDAWQTTSGGHRIYGAGSTNVIFKYPNCFDVASRFLATLQVVPTRIFVTGFVTGIDGLQGIELLGSDCGDAQTIDWNGARNVSIQLSAEGAERFALPASTTTIDVWPTSMLVAGSPTAAPEVSGKADILIGELAAGRQTLQFQRAAPRVSLELSQDGFGRFHVVPDVVRDIAEGRWPGGDGGSPNRLSRAKAILDEWDRIGIGELSPTSRKYLEDARARLQSGTL